MLIDPTPPLVAIITDPPPSTGGGVFDLTVFDMGAFDAVGGGLDQDAAPASITITTTTAPATGTFITDAAPPAAILEEA